MNLNSRLVQIYYDLQNILTEIKDSYENPLFQYINIWDNQVKNSIEGNTYSFATPAIFIEFNLNEAKPLMGGFTSYPNTLISFHIINNSLNVDEKLEQNLTVFALRDIVFAKMNGKALTFANAMMPNYESQDFAHDNTYEYILSFSTNFIDSKGAYDDLGKKSFGLLTNPTLNLNIIKYWYSKKEYKAYFTSLVNLVYYRGDIYLCKEDNNDELFDLEKWVLVKPWIPKVSYNQNEFVIINNFVYSCINANTDDVFIESNWQLIFNP